MPSVRCRYDGLAAAHRPNAPSTCTHASYVRATGIGGGEVVERPGVHLARLEADDRRTLAAGEHAAQVGDVDPALVVGVHLDDRVLTEAEVPDRAVDRVVPVPPHDDPHPRRLEQPAGGDVPARSGQHGVPRRRQTGVVGHHPAGDQADRRAGGETQRVDDPTAGHHLDRRGGGRQGVDAGVLVPGRGEHVRAQGGREVPADHETEEPRTRRPGQPGVGRGGQLVHHGDRVGPGLGHRTVEGLEHLLERHTRPHRPLAQPGEELRRQRVRPRQHPFRVIHGVTIVRPSADKVDAIDILERIRPWDGATSFNDPSREAEKEVRQ